MTVLKFVVFGLLVALASGQNFGMMDDYISGRLAHLQRQLEAQYQVAQYQALNDPFSGYSDGVGRFVGSLPTGDLTKSVETSAEPREKLKLDKPQVPRFRLGLGRSFWKNQPAAVIENGKVDDTHKAKFQQKEVQLEEEDESTQPAWMMENGTLTQTNSAKFSQSDTFFGTDQGMVHEHRTQVNDEKPEAEVEILPAKKEAEKVQEPAPKVQEFMLGGMKCKAIEKNGVSSLVCTSS
ncbi:unnamed protein product, partial [Mesorhabditis spiculigera]